MGSKISEILQTFGCVLGTVAVASAAALSRINFLAYAQAVIDIHIFIVFNPAAA